MVQSMLQIVVVVVAIYGAGGGWPVAAIAAGFSIILWLTYFAVIESIFRRHNP
jgi:F0F1-type ATP synthase assembly protein I